MRPTPKQIEAYNALKNNYTKEILYGGAAGGGKSWLGCEWLLMCCHFMPKSRWFIGRQELKRIRQSTLVTFFKVASHHGYTDFDLNGMDNYIRFKNGAQIDLLDLRYMPSDPLYERFGSLEYTGGWIEEAGEVNFGAYDVLRTRIGRHLNNEFEVISKLLITCNPKKNWLYTEFYQPFKSNELDAHKAFIQAFVDDNPFLTEDYKENLRNTKDKAKKERLLYGNWEYDDDPTALINYDSIVDIFSNIVPEGKEYITADIARFGKDKTVIMVWKGFKVVEVVVMDKSSVTNSANKITELRVKYGVPLSKVIVDEDGVGGGVKDIINCEGFVNNSRALNNENYSNLKSQCYFNLAERINNSGIYVNCNQEVKERLTEELEQVKQKDMDKDNKLAVLGKEEVKERLGRSPDYSDALMMREYFELKNTDAPKLRVFKR